MIKVSNLDEYVALDVLRNTCRRYCNDCSTCPLSKPCDGIRVMFKNLDIKYETSNEWVSVKDKLPPVHIPIIVKEGMYSTYVTMRERDNEDMFTNGTILAWLALPEFKGD